MGPILIIIAVLLVIAKHDKTKKRHKRTLWGKSDWEKTCDDGGKFLVGNYASKYTFSLFRGEISNQYVLI